MNIKRLFIFCMFLFFITISNVCSFKENSTETFLEETIVDEHLLNKNSNDTRSDVHLNSSNIVKYYGGSECYGAYLYDDNGDITLDINFEYNNRNKLLNPPSSYAHRISNIYYTDIVDENNMSIGYEGMRSFAVVKNNLTNDNLQYWLNKKELYE